MKRKTTLLAVLLLGLMFFPGCKSKQEKLMDAIIDNMEERAKVLATVTDAASAKAAKPKLEALNRKMEALGKDGPSDIAELSEEENKKLMVKYDSRMKAAAGKLGKQMNRIFSNPKLCEALGVSSWDTPKPSSSSITITPSTPAPSTP